MLENDIRTLFALEAAADQPPAQISAPVPDGRARARRQRHRVLAIGTPLLAAAAVTGILVGTLVISSGKPDRPSGPSAPGAPASATPPVSRTAPPVRPRGAQFDPTRLYAAFGWLPAGVRVVNGGTGGAWEFVNAANERSTSDWTLYAFAGDQCQLQPVPSRPGRSELNCSQNPDGSPLTITGRAPEINGHTAYRADGYLAWRYSGKGWAVLKNLPSCNPRPGAPCNPASPLAVKIARHAAIAASGPPLRFMARLTGLPRNWKLADTSFAPVSGQTAAYLFQVSSGTAVLPPAGAGWPDNTPQITVVPASSDIIQTVCSFSGGHPVTEIINGYRVQIARVPASTAYPRTQQLCAQDADGLFVYIDLIGNHPAASAAAIFRHLRLLGTNPASWATSPFG